MEKGGGGLVEYSGALSEFPNNKQVIKLHMLQNYVTVKLNITTVWLDTKSPK